MLLNTKSLTKQIKKNLKKRDPDLYKHITKSDIDKILMYWGKNATLCIKKKKDIYFNKFFSIHINKEDLIKKKIADLPEI